MEVGGQRHAPNAFSREGNSVPVVQEGRSDLDVCGKSPYPPAFDPRTVQPVARRYADCAIPAYLCSRRNYTFDPFQNVCVIITF